jgi:Rrf2 family protein
MFMGKHYASKNQITIAMLSERLAISKIYLEQVFTLLKRAELVISTKGSQGGYHLSKKPKEINAYEILFSTENSLFERTRRNKPENESTIEKTLYETIYSKLDRVVENMLSKISLADLLEELEKTESQEGYMYHL